MTNDWRDKYDEVWDFNDGFAQVWLNGEWGFVDVTGKEVVPPKYDEIESFS
ncbi:MAG: WG repeat-containing protein, partial [Holophagaceae bacterium]